MPKPGPRKEWTDAAMKQLRADYDRIPVSSLARKLKRSEGAVRQKAFSLGLKRPHGWGARVAASKKKAVKKTAKKVSRKSAIKGGLALLVG